MDQDNDIQNDQPNLPNVVYNKCESCDFQTTDPICLMDHVLIVHDGAFEDDDNVYDYYCDRCNINFDNNVDFDNHVDTIHKGNNNALISDTEDTDTEDTDTEDDNIDVDAKNDDIQNEGIQNEGILDESIQDDNIKNDDDDSKDDDSEIELDCDKVEKKNELLKKSKKEKKNVNDDPILLISQLLQKIQSQKPIIKTQKKYVCPSCNIAFRTQFHLGEHFTNKHTSYEEQSHLDTFTNYSSFPGFEILEELNVISLPSNKEMLKMAFSDQQCDICCKKYTMYNYVNDKKITSKDLDDELLEDNFKNIKNKSKHIFCDLWHDKILLFNKCYPLMLTCCQNIICGDCLKNHLLNSTYIKCPFCNNDHTKYDTDYIKIIDIVNLKPKFNKQSWINWWKRGNKVNNLAF